MTRSLLCSVAALLVFLCLFASVASGVSRGVDAYGLLWFRGGGDPEGRMGPAWVFESVRDFTSLGSNGVLCAIAAAWAGYLAVKGCRADAACVSGSVAGSLMVVALVKSVYGRPRPDIVAHSAQVFTSSFPSSHATLSAALCCVGVLLAWHTATGWQMRVYAVCVGCLFVAAIGASRLYLGVHWPTDILAGWALGLGCAGLTWSAMTFWRG